MKKDFDAWNRRKKEINDIEDISFYRARDIRWCSLGTNIGYEQDGTSETYRRPVLILRGFSRYVCLIIPLTTSVKENPYHFNIGDIDGKKASVILSQVRLVDTRCLHDPLAVLDKDKFEEIRKAIRNLI